MGATTTFKKGMVVKIVPETDWSDHFVTDYDTGEVLCEFIWRPRTEAEHQEWLDSDASKGLNDAGETKLDSPTRSRRAKLDELFKVVRARVSAPRGWGNPIPGCAEIVDAEGVHWFCHRKHMH